MNEFHFKFLIGDLKIFLMKTRGFDVKWVGLTGGLGTGKSTVAGLLLKLGIPVIDADRLAKQVVEPGSQGLAKVIQVFGPEILSSSKTLDREKMAGLVFSDPKKLKQLEEILHPLVQEEVRHQKKWLMDQHTPWAVYDVPLLFEKKLQAQFDSILLVTCSKEKQWERIRKRNHWNDQEIQKRVDSQLPLKDKIELSHHILQNDGSLEDLQKKVATFVQLMNDETQGEI
jgi:dephospho-CoA kinase